MRRLGLTTLFGNPGSTELPMFRGFPADFRYVLGLQEAVVVGMADGYAQATRNAALVNLHSAAGVGNAMGAIFTASRNQTPLVITAGQQARSLLAHEAFLSSPQAPELTKPHVKWSVEPARAEDVPQAIARAYFLAMAPPRGPVFVSIPADDWDRPAGALLPERVVSSRLGADSSSLTLVAQKLSASRQPAFVIGSGVDRDGAWDDVVALAERHRARVFSAALAGRYGFPQDHPLFAGFLPAKREGVVEALAGHDLIVVLGGPAFTYHMEGSGPHIPEGCELCQIVDDANMASWTPVGTSVIAGLKASLQYLLVHSVPSPREAPAPRARAPRVSSSEPMSAAWVFQALADLRDPTSVVVEEAPSSRESMQAHLPVVRSGGFYAMDSGGLGFAMPAAVGIALGDATRKVICVVGDGSSMYSFQALWTAAQWRLPITFLVLNNGGYAAVRRFASKFGFAPEERVPGSELPGLDFVHLAQGVGCRATKARTGAELVAALRSSLKAAEPTLVEVHIE